MCERINYWIEHFMHKGWNGSELTMIANRICLYTSVSGPLRTADRFDHDTPAQSPPWSGLQMGASRDWRWPTHASRNLAKILRITSKSLQFEVPELKEAPI
jgi:hypothetical protein